MAPISFPIKLWNVLLAADKREIIRWSDDGREVLLDESRFDDLVYYNPMFLRQPTLSGLHRLFTVYDFTVNYGSYATDGWCRFSHPCFRRGRPDLLELLLLAHQTRRYNARKTKADAAADGQESSCKRRKNAAAPAAGRRVKSDRMFGFGCNSQDDLQPLYPCPLLEFHHLSGGLDGGSPLPVIIEESGQQPCSPDPASRVCLETEDVAESDSAAMSYASPCAETQVHNSWMSYMDERDEWFGLQGEPVAIPITCDAAEYEQHILSASLLLLADTCRVGTGHNVLNT